MKEVLLINAHAYTHFDRTRNREVFGSIEDAEQVDDALWRR